MRALGGPVLMLLAASVPAAANPRPLPYSYPYVTLPGGDFDVDQYVDMTPVRVEREDARCRSCKYLSAVSERLRGSKEN